MGMELIAPIIGALASTAFSALTSKKAKEPTAPTADAVKAPAPLQAPVSPNMGAAGASGNYGGGPSSTQLSGAGGVDPSLLNIGKNTLLGA